MSDVDDEYMERLDQDLREIRGALFDDTLAVLSPAEPVCVSERVTVQEAVKAMVARHQAGVLVVDGEGLLAGIFTERDVLRRVVGQRHDPAGTAVGVVMTSGPEALRMRDRVAHALHCMAVSGYRTIPIVDEARRPIGVVTATDVIRWLANLFPEAVLNMRPGDAIKNPQQIDSG
ncbi:MAG: CBS domain-containing protein [Candidatus Rokubacteria bacterium]|nr:CBS domain-containing protein [Candidatus Rokubacteria bacterium]